MKQKLLSKEIVKLLVFPYFLIVKDSYQPKILKKLTRSTILYMRCSYYRLMTEIIAGKSNLQLNCDYLRFIVHATIFISFIVFGIIMCDYRKVLVEHGPSPTNPFHW